MRIRLEGVPHRYHEDHISAKGITSLSRCNLEHKFIPMRWAWKIPVAKAAVENVKNRRKYRHGSWRKSETRRRSSRKPGIKAEKFLLHHWISLTSRIRNWRFIFEKKRLGRTPRCYCERLSRIARSICWNKDHQRHRWQPPRFMWTTSSRCNIRLSQVIMEDALTSLKIPKTEDRYLDTTTEWRNCNLRKFFWNTLENKFWTGNVNQEQEDCANLCMWTISHWLERKKTQVQHGKH